MSGRALEGQIAVVTGGGSGIGLAAVRLLAQHGAVVVVLDRDGPAAEAAATGSPGAAVTVDLADTARIPATVAAILAEHGRIDILVNSAGISAAPHSTLDFSDEVLELVLAINLKAPAVLTREVGRHMVERGGGGRIVNVSSSAAFTAKLAPAIYAATKAGVNGLTRSAAADLGPHDINVNAVAPGLTRTPMTTAIGDEEAFQRLVSAGAPLENLLERASEPEDVAEVIVFLCLPGSRQVTGQVLHTSAGHVV